MNLLYKGLDRCLLWWLKDEMGSKLTFKHLEAYQPLKGTDTALSKVINYMEKNALRSNFEHCVIASLDISGAFDRVKYEQVIKAMHAKKVPPNFI